MSDPTFFASESSSEPSPDIAKCSECGWTGPVSDCEKGEDGDWESGYYQIDLCPKCKDGGCVDDYSMSESRIDEWEKWNAKNNHGPAPHPLDDTDEPDAQRRATAADTEECAAQREAME